MLLIIFILLSLIKVHNRSDYITHKLVRENITKYSPMSINSLS